MSGVIKMKFNKKLLAMALSAVCLPVISFIQQTSGTLVSHAEKDEVFEVDGMTFKFRRDKENELILTNYSGTDENLKVPEIVDEKRVTGIGYGAFQGNKAIKNVTLPDSADYFESNVFADSSLETVNIPDSLYVIPNHTFYKCENLKSVEKYKDIQFIAQNAFENASLKSPSHLNYYAEDSYSVYSFKLNYQDILLQECIFHEGSASDIVFPEKINGKSVQSFDKGLFFKSYELRGDYPFTKYYLKTSLDCHADINSVEFGKYLNSINTTVFNNHPELKNITINANNVQIIRQAFINTGIEELNLKNPSQIGQNAFENCQNLKSIHFADCSNRTIINQSAFLNCTDLQTVEIDGSPQNITIDSSAFKNCTSLETLKIPQDCKRLNIGNEAFFNTNLKSLEINCECMIKSEAFRKCPVESVTINGTAEINSTAFQECDYLKNLNINTSYDITGSTFNGCSSLMTINSKPVLDSETGDFDPEISDYIFKNFNSCENVGFINEYIKAQVKKVVAENTNDSMSDLQKVKVLHDWVCSNTEYDFTDSPKCHTDGSIFLNDSTQCEGYARMYNLLLNEAGIETYYVHSSTHAWNVIKLGNCCFHVDTTWDDSENSYNWFLKSDQEMMNTDEHHSNWSLKIPSELHSFQGSVLPECTQKMGDVNADSDVSIADSVLILQSIANPDKYKLSETSRITGDVCNTGDGITASDALSIQKKEAKIIESLPEIN